MKRIMLSFAGLLMILTSYSQAIRWYSIEEAMAMTKEKPCKVVIDVYTTWCRWCKVMDTTTFEDPVIAAYLNENFYPVKFDAEQKGDVTFNGKTYKFVPAGAKGYHELAATWLSGNLGYPSIVFLDDTGSVITPIQGYFKPKPFDQIAKFIGGDHYKTQKWEDFSATYVSPIQE